MTRTELFKQLGVLTKGLQLISESERPVRVLHLSVKTEKELLQLLSALVNKPEESFIKGDLRELFSSVQRMADPGDEAMIEYAGRFAALESFLLENLSELTLLRVGRPEVNLFITGFTKPEHESVVLHTVAIQT